MLALIHAIHDELKGAYGSLRMVLELRARGFSAGKTRVERMMREHGIRARHKRKFKVTTDSKHKLPIAPNLLDRNSAPAAPNQVWTSDITYLWTDEGWLYLACLKLLGQCADRKLVQQLKNERVHGWRFATREDMTATAFEYIEVFYNRRRLHSTLGYKSPRRFLQDWLNAPQRDKQVA